MPNLKTDEQREIVGLNSKTVHIEFSTMSVSKHFKTLAFRLAFFKSKQI